MRELEDNNKRWCIRTFADEILLLESEINALNWRRSFLDRGRLLDLCESYISALGTLSRFVEKVQFSSEGLSRFASFLDDYCTGSEFLSLCTAVSKTRESFANSFKDDNDVLFLRAERLESGKRAFRIINGEPLPTAYGEDLYRRIFSEQ